MYDLSATWSINISNPRSIILFSLNAISEPPQPPDAPTSTSTQTTAITLSWSAPASGEFLRYKLTNNGPNQNNVVM